PSGVLGKLLLTLRPRPAVSDKTAAASDAKAEEATADTNAGSVRGGTSSNTNGRPGANDGSNFNIDPKVVDSKAVDPKAVDCEALRRNAKRDADGKLIIPKECEQPDAPAKKSP